MAAYNGTFKRRNAGNTDWDDIIPNIDGTNITTGEVPIARIPSITNDKLATGIDGAKITGGAVPIGSIPNIPASKLLTGISGSLITTGEIPASVLPALAMTSVSVFTTELALLALYDGSNLQEGDVVILTTDNKTLIHNGGVADTIADFNELATPTDVVTSVVGQTGAVSYVNLRSALDITNVDDTADTAKPVSTLQAAAIALKKDDFSENQAFNKDFSSSAQAGYVCEADDARLSNARTPLSHNINTHVAGNSKMFYTTSGGIITEIAMGAANEFLKSAGTTSVPLWAALTKNSVGLSAVDNTSDANKPVSTAQQTALDGKQKVFGLMDSTVFASHPGPEAGELVFVYPA